MTSLREAAQQALEALEHAPGYSMRRIDAMDALRAALAEPVQEPVAWMVYTLDGKSVCVTDSPADFTDEHRVLPLYTAPPLTEECLNCASLQDQNTELDRKLAELQDAIMRGNRIS